MRIALYGSIAWRHPFGFRQVIDWAKQFGWDCVDARGMCIGIPGDPCNYLDAFGYDMLGPRQIRPSARVDLHHVLKEAGTPLCGIYCSSPLNLPGEQGKRYRQLFCEYLELGVDLEAEWVRPIYNTQATYQGPEMSRQEAYERITEGAREVGLLAAEIGIGLLFENNENTVHANAAELLQLQRDVSDVCRVGIAYDPVNAYFQGNDPQQELDALRGQIDVLHVKNVRRVARFQDGYMPRGEHHYAWTTLSDGDLDWRQLIPRAAQDGFDGTIVFEYVNPFKGMPLSYWNTIREPPVAAHEEAEYLRSILNLLD